MPPTSAGAILRQIQKLVAEQDPGHLPDHQLLDRFTAQADEPAFEALVQRHGPMVLRVCRGVLRSPHDAEDAFQATFLVLLRKASRIRQRQSVASWLYKVAYRVALQARADTTRRSDCEAHVVPRPPADPVEDVTWREVQAIVDEEMQRLPDKYRAPLLLCCLEGRTRDEAAQELGWSLGTLKRRLEQGRERLRVRLAGRGLTLSSAMLASLLTPVVTSAGSAEILVQVTVRTARLAATGQTFASTEVAALVRGVTNTLWAAKLKMAAVGVLALSLVITGLGWAVHQVWTSETLLTGPNPSSQPPGQTEVERRSHTDRYGDPLPPDALARMGTVRLRHGSWVACTAFAPDGKLLASGGADRAVRFWEVATGKEIRRLDHEGAVCSLAFSPGGQTLVSGDDQGTVRLWDVATGQARRRLKARGRVAPHECRFSTVSFSPDGHSLVAGDSDGVIHQWEASTGKLLREFHREGNEVGEVRCVIFSPDGRTLVSGGNDQIIRLWEVATGKEIRQFRGHAKEISAVAFSPDGQTLASGGLNQPELRLWDVSSGKEVRQLEGKWGFLAIRFSPDGKTLFTGGQDGLTRHWDLATGKELRVFEGKPGWVSSVALSRDSKTVAAAADRRIYLWDLATGKDLVPAHGHPQMIWSVALSPEGKLLATADYRTIRFWDAGTGRELRQCIGHPGRGDLIVFAPDGKTLASNGWDLKLRLWEAATGKELRRFEGHRELACGLAFSPDGKWLASSSMDKTLRLWDVSTGQEIRQFPGRNELVKGLAFSPDGKVLATGSMDPWAIRWWDVATGQEIRSVANLPAAVWSVAFAPDGKTLASASCRNNFIVSYGKDEQIRLWDVATGRERMNFGGHPGGYYQIRFSGDGRTLVSAGEDHVVRLWEVATGKERRRFLGHTGPVSSVALSADGRVLGSGSSDTTALVWDVTGLARPRRTSIDLTPAQTTALWADLGSDDAAKAYQAMCAFLATPRQAVPLLKDRLRPVPPIERQRLDPLIAGLDSDNFGERTRAGKELERLGELAEPALQLVLKGSPSLEVRRRAEDLLQKLEKTPFSGERLQALRAVEVLEHIGTAEARQVLEVVSQGAPGARLTREAKASLERLAQRVVTAP
jgi:RNA polymerase sigma factor (sigma-70 family)